jgi:hypothetical protein
MYIFQSGSGYWWIAKETSTKFHLSQLDKVIDRPFDTRQLAETALSAWRAAGGQATRAWR